MVKRGWEISGYSLSGLEMRWAAIWTGTQVSWQLWIMPLRAMDGFSGKDSHLDRPLPQISHSKRVPRVPNLCRSRGGHHFLLTALFDRIGTTLGDGKRCVSAADRLPPKFTQASSGPVRQNRLFFINTFVIWSAKSSPVGPNITRCMAGRTPRTVVC